MAARRRPGAIRTSTTAEFPAAVASRSRRYRAAASRSHAAFADKYHLPFPLLPDDKGELAAKYKVPVTGGVARRITYLIGKDGKIAHVWPTVSPVGHAGEILSQISGQIEPTAAKTN